MNKENKKLMENIKKFDKAKLPKWFHGELYEKGGEVRNRFSGDSCYLNNVELSMYDYVIGATQMIEMGIFNTPHHIQELRKGLSWFRKTNPEAYMILLD
jgi:hypothetical protein